LSAADPENRKSDFFSTGAPARTEPQMSRPEPSWVDPQPPAPNLPAVTALAPAAPFEPDAPVATAQFALRPLAQSLLQRLADLLRRADTPTPLALGLLAPAGGGKSSALRWLIENVQIPGAPVVALRAGDLAAEPERALAAALFRAVSRNNPALAHEAAQDGAHMGADAGAYARSAHEKLDLLRRKLMVERQNLTQTEGRRAALTETLLYDTPGSRVDSYARRLRAAVEPRLRRFGFAGDPLASFKDLTRDLAESGALPARLLSSLRAIYAFRGQVRLLVYAALCFGLNWGASWLAANKSLWLGAVANTSTQGAQAAEYVGGHIDWLPQAATAFSLLGLALIGLNLWRAFSFMQPLIHAAGLLDQDVGAKKLELDQVLAHQARNVDLLGAETAAVAKQAAEAERRAVAAGASKHPPLFLETDAATQKCEFARGFLHSLSNAIDKTKAGDAPRKIIVAVDGFESVGNPVALFDRLHDLLARPGFVAIFALDPEIFGPTGQADFVRRIQLPLRLDAGASAAPSIALAPLDAPLSPLEARLIGAMAPLAGGSPRLEKRLRNLFRFLRPAPGAPSGLAAALALFLAADLGASPDDRRRLIATLTGTGAETSPKNAPPLDDALANIVAIEGPIDRETAKLAASLAHYLTLN
jgi:hypothetical protein